MCVVRQESGFLFLNLPNPFTWYYGYNTDITLKVQEKTRENDMKVV